MNKEKSETDQLPELLKGKKVSQVFLEFCSPVFDDLSDEDAKNLEFISDALRVPWMIWNATLLEEKRKGSQMAYHKRMKMMTKTLPYAEPMLDFWKRRKIEDFGQYKYLMGEYKLIPLEGYTFSLRIEARSIG